MRLFAISLAIAFGPSTVLAADPGTYRPGTPYHSSVLPTASACAEKCSGDDNCRTWNYVKVNARSPGVCEFQSRVSAPVESDVSTSGLSAAPTRRSHRVVDGSTRTIRVGEPRFAVATPSQPPRWQAASTPQRIVSRGPQPQQLKPILDHGPTVRPGIPPTSPVSMPMRQQIVPTVSPVRHGPILQHSLGVPFPTHIQPNPEIVSAKASVATRPRPAATPQLPGPVHARTAPGRPPIGQTIPAPDWPLKPTPNAAPAQSHPPQSLPVSQLQLRPAKHPTQPSAVRPVMPTPQPGRPAQPSLYGHLFDKVPPLDTVNKRPVTRVSQESLGPAARR